MNEMIDRLAQAILKEMAGPSGFTHIKDSSSDMTTVHIEGVFDMQAVARAALKELRELTDDLCERAANKSACGVDAPDVYAVWEATIDTILE